MPAPYTTLWYAHLSLTRHAHPACRVIETQYLRTTPKGQYRLRHPSTKFGLLAWPSHCPATPKNAEPHFAPPPRRRNSKSLALTQRLGILRANYRKTVTFDWSATLSPLTRHRRHHLPGSPCRSAMRGEGGNLNLSPSRSPPSPHTPHPPQAWHAPCGQGESGRKISLPRPPIRAERRQHRFSPPPGKHTIVDSPTPLENTADTDTGRTAPIAD